MDKKLILLPIILLAFSFTISAQKNGEKKLIEFGWDYPRSSFIAANIDGMQKSPFDGVVFSLDAGIYNAFDPAELPDSFFDYKVLSKISWQNLTDNFLFVRGAGLTGPHWLDDDIWKIIVQNLTKVSKALAVSNAKGIAFDPEYYYKNPDYNSWKYSPALYDGLSYEQVGKAVRKRGKQFILALQTYKPDVKILCFWLLGLVYDQNIHQRLSETGMALYPFFVEGMLEGKDSSSEIIDGNESSYWYQNFESFINSGQFVREKEINLINNSLQIEFKKIHLAQSVYFDGLFALLPKFEKGFDRQTKERWLWDNLYFAFKTTDKYVWFYSERLNWWKGLADSDVFRIIIDVRNKIKTEQNNKLDQIIGKSFVKNFRKKEPDNYQGFFYNYIKSKNNLQIKLLNGGIQILRVYKNSRLIYEIKNPSMTFTIDLNRRYDYNGNLIIFSKDNKGISSVAFVN